MLGHATHTYSNECRVNILLYMLQLTSRFVWWQLFSTMKLSHSLVMQILHLSHASPGGVDVRRRTLYPLPVPPVRFFSLPPFFQDFLKLEQDQSQYFECHTVGACQPFFFLSNIPSIALPPPPLFFQQGVGEPQCYHSLILFESGRVWAGKGAKRASWVVRGGNCVISKGRVVKNNWAI